MENILEKDIITEEHKLMKKVIEIIEYGNLQDLKTINKYLYNNEFSVKKANDLEKIKNDICKIVDKLDELRQTDINLKYLIEKNGEVS